MLNPFTTLALYLAHKAGLLPWAKLPHHVQVQCIRAGAAASHAQYTATLATAAKQWCHAAQLRTGGVWLTNPALPTVQHSTAPTTTAVTVVAKRIAALPPGRW